MCYIYVQVGQNLIQLNPRRSRRERTRGSYSLIRR